MKPVIHAKYEEGQSWVLLAVTVIVLIIFVGFAIDSAILFSNYTKLKRAVDAAAIAAANDFKRAATVDLMTQSAKEMIALHQLDVSTGAIDLKLYICSQDPSADRDETLLINAPDFYYKCPDVANGETPRKLVYIQASQNMPTYFLHLLGVNSIRLSTSSISEAAPLDLVLVFDTSESMGNLTTGTPGYVADNFDPSHCNTTNIPEEKCQPLQTAKDAAVTLIGDLYPGYDRVAIVTFDQLAITRFNLNGNLEDAKTAAGNVPLHDDAPAKKLFADWYWHGVNGRVNPVNPEDRDGDGQDADNAASTDCNVSTADKDGNPLPIGKWLDWDYTKGTPGEGIPCDKPNQLDAFDWDQDGMLDASDVAKSNAWITDHRDPLIPADIPPLPMSIVSTCSGCGMREAAKVLVNGGRSNSVQVIVFLSDGVANLSDTSATFPYDATSKTGIPSIYPNGFCGGYLYHSGGTLLPNFWMNKCVDMSLTIRSCIDTATNQCPLSYAPLSRVVHTPAEDGYSGPNFSPPYSAEDYARDVTDAVALLTSPNNPNEKTTGNDITIFTVGLGNDAAFGSDLLRYMASVGDDGNRDTDPCYTVIEDAAHKGKTNCGNYYFAATKDDLAPVFDSIASRIYTKISE